MLALVLTLTVAALAVTDPNATAAPKLTAVLLFAAASMLPKLADPALMRPSCAVLIEKPPVALSPMDMVPDVLR